jgi:hypothetical protein
MRKILLALLSFGLLSSLSFAQSDDATPSEVPSKISSGKTLVGSWQRPDGDYTIGITAVNEDGTLQAGYFNPSPIRVAGARWRFSGDSLQIRVDLNDTGYEGAYYILRFNAETDQLEGDYQPAGQESFTVVFERTLGPVAR